MKNLSKQVVILDNISSDYIHQAIIILKSYPPGMHDKIIEEAERIVAAYFDKSASGGLINEKNNTKALKSVVMILSVALAVCAYFAFFR